MYSKFVTPRFLLCMAGFLFSSLAFADTPPININPATAIFSSLASAFIPLGESMLVVVSVVVLFKRYLVPFLEETAGMAPGTLSTGGSAAKSRNRPRVNRRNFRRSVEAAKRSAEYEAQYDDVVSVKFHGREYFVPKSAYNDYVQRNFYGFDFQKVVKQPMTEVFSDPFDPFSE